MPFKSEKQQRFLWSQHPDIAQRWADEYPGQKNLPTYAHGKKDGGDKPAKAKKEKSAAEILEPVLTKFCTQLVNPGPQRTYVKSEKQSDSKLERLNIPHESKPTYAGQEPVTAGAEVGCENPVKNVSEPAVNKDKIAADALMNKLAVVLSPVVQQALAAEQAQQSGQPAPYTPQNAGVDLSGPKPNVNIQPPMGMAAPQQPAQPMAAMQPQQAAQPAPVVQPKTAAVNMLPPQTAPKGPLPPGKPSRPVTPHPRATIDPEAQRKQLRPVNSSNSELGNTINTLGGLAVDGKLTGNGAGFNKTSADPYPGQKGASASFRTTQQALRANPNERTVRQYLQQWVAKHKTRPDYAVDSWEDLEDDLPLRYGPGGFDPRYITDELHTDIGNRLRDPKQFGAAVANLLPKLDLKPKTAPAGKPQQDIPQ
jgi:hypothetical protein